MTDNITLSPLTRAVPLDNGIRLETRSDIPEGDEFEVEKHLLLTTDEVTALREAFAGDPGDPGDDLPFSERGLAIIETALLYFSTDAHVNGTFDSAADARRLAEKVRGERDSDDIPEPAGEV